MANTATTENTVTDFTYTAPDPDTEPGDDTRGTTEDQFAELLTNVILDSEDDMGGVHRVETFEEAMLMTRDTGLVIRLEDGSEFQVRIKRSR